MNIQNIYLNAICLVIIDFFKILLPTFIGAYLAFKYQNYQKNREREDNKYSILIKSQSALISQYNFIEDVRQQYTQIDWHY